MKKRTLILVLLSVITLFTLARLFAHDDETPAAKSSAARSNIWNAAQEPTNWWNEIKQTHGHVGPWNILGWRMGKAALRELNAAWGQHEVDVICYIPLKTPYSCIADGLVVGTGNSIGRLDIRLGEVMTMADVHVSVRRKDGIGPVLLLKPKLEYLEKIRSQPDEQLDALAHECGQLSEEKLFLVEKLPQSEKNLKNH
jgi:formylmethanofuran dehydrogenase subunit E